jgi:hypothetical protein
VCGGQYLTPSAFSCKYLRGNEIPRDSFVTEFGLFECVFGGLGRSGKRYEKAMEMDL